MGPSKVREKKSEATSTIPDSPRNKSNGLKTAKHSTSGARTNALTKSLSSPKPASTPTSADLVMSAAALKPKLSVSITTKKPLAKEKDADTTESQMIKSATPPSTPLPPPPRPSPAVSPTHDAEESLVAVPTALVTSTGKDSKSKGNSVRRRETRLPVAALKAKSTQELGQSGADSSGSLTPSPQPSKVTLEDFFKKVPQSTSKRSSIVESNISAKAKHKEPTMGTRNII